MKQPLSLGLRLEQRLGLKQIIQLGNFLSLPHMIVDKVMESIVDDPAKVEGFLKDQPDNKRDYRYNINEMTKAVYGTLADSSQRKGKDMGGLIMTPPSRRLIGLVQADVDLEVMPDVTYFGRSSEKPHIMYSQHLITAPKMALKMKTMPAEFANAKKLLSILSNFREWKNSTLMEIYVLIGDKQREFCATLDPTQLHVYAQSDLANATNLSDSSISRLLQERYALVKAFSGEEQIHPIRHLIPTKDIINRYDVIKQMNDVLARESGEHTFCDQEIKVKIPNAARRTVTKYRLEAGIPAERDRKIALFSGSDRTYRIPYFARESSE